MTTAVLLVLLGALSRLLPHPPNFVAVGALALYSGARLPRRLAWIVPLAAMALADLLLDAGTGRPILSPVRLTIYATFAAIVFLGFWGRRLASSRPGWMVWPCLSISASVLFFVTSNFAEWLLDPGYPKTVAGCMLCYARGDSVLRQHARGPTCSVRRCSSVSTPRRAGRASVLARGREPLPRSRWRWPAAPLPARLDAQSPAPAPAGTPTPTTASESVVVSATLSPEDERAIGSATTVITRERIEASGEANVLELLRTVPGVDVSQQGGSGALTSVFLRGTNSTQTLVLVDGVRVNSPYFAGIRFFGVDDRKHRAHRDRPRAVLGALRIRRDRRSDPDLHAQRRRPPDLQRGVERSKQAAPDSDRAPRSSRPRPGRHRSRRLFGTPGSTAIAPTRTGGKRTGPCVSRRASPTTCAWESRARSSTGIPEIRERSAHSIPRRAASFARSGSRCPSRFRPPRATA